MIILEQTRQKKAWHSYLELGQVLSYSGLEESVRKACDPSPEMTFVGVLFNSILFCFSEIARHQLREEMKQTMKIAYAEGTFRNLYTQWETCFANILS